jgi:ankyrin repeat protein
LKGLSLLLDFGESPLHMAISRSASVDIISLLILGGVDVNLENKSGNTALYEAVKHFTLHLNAGSPEVVELLLEIEDVDVNKANGVFTEGQTPLFIASQWGNANIVKLLLGKDDVEVNKASTAGETPLFIASQFGHKDVVELLLGKDGVEVNEANKNGATPLIIASRWNKANIVNLLLGKDGVDVYKANTNGETPLIMAMQGEERGVVELLLGKKGVDVESLLGLKGLDKANFDGKLRCL